jgi:hypothetical protein
VYHNKEVMDKGPLLRLRRPKQPNLDNKGFTTLYKNHFSVHFVELMFWVPH